MSDTPIDRERLRKEANAYRVYGADWFADNIEALLAALDEAEAECDRLAEKLARARAEERAKGMERAGSILLDHPHSTRWHVLKTIRAEAAAIRARGKT